MFYSAKDPTSHGMVYELKVFSMLKKAFDNNFAFGINGYPMFYSNGQSHREIDILFAHRTLGIFNIEVKGMKIDQIKQIIGHSWHMTEDFYDDEITPFEQAQKQTFMLQDFLNKSLMLGKKVNIATIIAVPEITRTEWESRGFHQQLNTPTPIFKDDLMTVEALQHKLLSYTQHVKKRPLLDDDWQRLLSAFQIEETQEEILPDEVFEIETEEEKHSISKYNIQVFSKLIVFESFEQFQQSIPKIEKLLFEGVKFYLFDQQQQIRSYCENKFPTYMKEFQLEIFEPTTELALIPYCEIINGNFQSNQQLFNRIKLKYNQFNAGQYEAIHCPVEKNEMITAGAGTGKTHVMIDRIMYLITVARVNLRNIIMITFTNASTNEMRNRLEKKFITLSELTGSSRYLPLAEDVRTMQISTIHAYAKQVIQTLAHELGFGKTIQLRSFVYEKKLIIQRLIDAYFLHEKIEFFHQHSLKHYDLTDFIYKIWDEMEKKGLSKEDIQRGLDWGQADEKSQYIANLIQFVFEHCEDELDKLKMSTNAITMGDLIRKLKTFTGNAEALQQLHQNCFMFVDEFQDSDDVQIAFIAQLQKIANYKLFVVGDIKQSIYRFRGADYRSFKVLESHLEDAQAPVQISLKHNYRSSTSILNKMDKLFSVWGTLQDPLLTYGADARLESNTGAKYQKDWVVKSFNNYNRKKEIATTISTALQTLRGEESKIALLVRTNAQAKEVKKICDDLNIATTENLDGTFFTSDTVMHFKALIEGLLYSNEPKFLVNAIETPYFNTKISPQLLMPYKGDKDLINEALTPVRQQTIAPYIPLLRENSVMAIIQMIIAEQQVLHKLQYYYEQQNYSSEQAKILATQYVANLQHVMTLIERNFSQKNLSLYTLRNWLMIHMNTNRTENEPVVKDSPAKVVISTVHRSKGLEFDTVILPITDRQYNAVKSNFYIEDQVQPNGSRKIGWHLQTKNLMDPFANQHYYTLGKVEIAEQRKEEARLLYVAFTRAEQRVFVLIPENYCSDTWSDLLKLANIERMMS